jgi:WhiB family transcriptional regulator, redox-sensing transcriptional regulator
MERLSNVPARPYLVHAAVARQLERTNEDWQLLSACQSADPDLFFPVSSSGTSLEQVAAAKAVCACCLVRFPCLAFALRTRQLHGIWGGLTEEERTLPTQREEARRDVINPPASA